jgi:hypothetical protein
VAVPGNDRDAVVRPQRAEVRFEAREDSLEIDREGVLLVEIDQHVDRLRRGVAGGRRSVHPGQRDGRFGLALGEVVDGDRLAVDQQPEVILRESGHRQTVAIAHRDFDFDDPHLDLLREATVRRGRFLGRERPGDRSGERQDGRDERESRHGDSFRGAVLQGFKHIPGQADAVQPSSARTASARIAPSSATIDRPSSAVAAAGSPQ